MVIWVRRRRLEPVSRRHRRCGEVISEFPQWKATAYEFEIETDRLHCPQLRWDHCEASEFGTIFTIRFFQGLANPSWQALILANERSDHWKDIATSTVGAMFFGVPHRGADKAYWAALAVRLVRISSLGAIGNNRFLDSLKRNSTEFSKISEAFTQPAARLQKIKSFYETKKIGNDVVCLQT